MLTYRDLFHYINLGDILDIAVVTFLIYRILLIVQGTRAVQMLIGLMAVATLYWVSLSYELYSLGWVLKHFFDSFFVIAVVIFQDQIRTALVTFGETRFWGRRQYARYDYVIEEVVLATHNLSRDCTGALIVFERNLGLLNYTSTGTRIDGLVTSDILYSLFQTRSSLHDGAVILSLNKILAAGCFLPLSKSMEMDRQFGTRHRAALGITEVSDAVVVVVSEETGQISLCYEGFFYRMQNEDDLRKNLRKILESGVFKGRLSLRSKGAAR